MIAITVLVVALIAATAVGLVLRARNGTVRRPASPDTSTHVRGLLVAAGAQAGTVTVLHFSADWCGPCAAVRRIVGQVVGQFGDDMRDVRELELDIDAHPELARAMGVLSLPTTFVLTGLTETARISGVPDARALRSALAVGGPASGSA